MTARRFFYVTAINGPRVYYIAGPYDTHESALAAVQPAKVIGDRQDPYSCFHAWGTSGSAEVLDTGLGPEWTP